MTVPPDLSAGRCAPGNSALSPEAWSADATPAQRWAAVRHCEACPVLAACREHAVTAPYAPAGGITAGLTKVQLDAERKRCRESGPLLLADRA